MRVRLIGSRSADSDVFGQNMSATLGIKLAMRKKVGTVECFQCRRVQQNF